MASPSAQHPTSDTTRETHRAWPHTPFATDPARSGTHAACGAPRRHTMPSALAGVKCGGGAGRTSVSQSLSRTGHCVRRTFAEGVANVGEISEFPREMARPAGLEPATIGLEGRKCCYPELRETRRKFFRLTGCFQGDPGLAARPRLAAAPPRGPPLAHGARSRRRSQHRHPARNCHAHRHGWRQGPAVGLTSGGAGVRRRTRITGYAADHRPLNGRDASPTRRRPPSTAA